MLACLTASGIASMSRAQTPPPGAARDDAAERSGDDIVITGLRIPGSAIGDVAPVAALNEDAIRALGATTMKELLQRLKPLTASVGGGEPIVLLNGHRISGFGELQSLPPEAMERTEVLPEQEAVRFGYPPTTRVLNFITKKRFQAVMAQQFSGVTTDGGGEIGYSELTSTRLDGPRRTSLTVNYERRNPILQGERDTQPDPATPFAVGGNVVGLNGGSIDPALDVLAGRPVTIAALPADPAARRALAGYADGKPAVTDLGPYRSLVQRSDTLKVDGTMAAPIGKAVDGSLNLSMEARRNTGLTGLAPVQLTVPAGTGVLPFAGPVSVYRYLPDVVLRQRGTSLTLHGGGTVQGRVGNWAWNMTGSYDRVRGTAASDRGVPVDRLQAAVDRGGDPLAPADADTLARRLTSRSRTTTGTLVGKAVANGPLVRLPAGTAQVTVSADYARSSSNGSQSGSIQPALSLTRSIRGASVNASVPIASAAENALAFMGRLSANGTVGVSDVSDYGRLFSANYGLNWSPARPVELNATFDRTQTAPPIATLTNPVLVLPNTPFFDYATGSNVLVTSIFGGNPALDPERRETMTLGVALSPIKGKELRLGVDYVDTRIRNQAVPLDGATAAIQAAFPGQFRRDARGTLVAVDLRPVNIEEEHDRRLRLSGSLWTQLGPEPPPPAAAPGAAAGTTPPPPPPKPRPSIFVSLTTTLRLENRVLLRPGFAALDLLDGAALTGTGGRPRWELESNVGGVIGPVHLGLFTQAQGPTRVRSTLAASDLRFSGRVFSAFYGMVQVEQIVRRPWTKSLTINVSVDNVLNDRINVRDRNGDTPNRFQPAFLDPFGRTIRLGVRKLF